MKEGDEIEVRLCMKEKYKFGGYRLIRLKLFDQKGGDFVENPDLSIIVVEK